MSFFCPHRIFEGLQREVADQVLQAVKFTDKNAPGLSLALDQCGCLCFCVGRCFVCLFGFVFWCVFLLFAFCSLCFGFCTRNVTRDLDYVSVLYQFTFAAITASAPARVN